MAVDSYSAPDIPPAEILCPRCEVSMPVDAVFCPECGRSMRPLTQGERWAAVSGYFTLVPAAVLLFLPAFRKSSFVRFHAWQSILLWGVFFLWVVLSFKAWQGERFELPWFGSLAGRMG